MAQSLTIGWTNPASAVARQQSVGFAVSSIETTDVTNGGQWYWNSSMPAGYYVAVPTGAVPGASVGPPGCAPRHLPRCKNLVRCL